MAEGGKSIDFILGNSLSELDKLPKNHFDLIFVDGDHSYDHVLPEFKLVEKLVSRGGVIVYHDTIHLDGPRKLVEYAAHFKYNNITLNTTEGRGLSILHR
jgi:predicted O-methyltransferase YrrM